MIKRQIKTVAVATPRTNKSGAGGSGRNSDGSRPGFEGQGSLAGTPAPPGPQEPAPPAPSIPAPGRLQGAASRGMLPPRARAASRRHADWAG